MLGPGVPSLTFVMPDHRRQVEPDDDILGTVLLCLGFFGKCVERECGRGNRQGYNQTREEFRQRPHFLNSRLALTRSHRPSMGRESSHHKPQRQRESADDRGEMNELAGNLGV